MLKFGSIQLDIPFIQAPLSGYTDYPMRILARRHGCPLTFTGVMLDKIALHHKALRKKEFQPHDDEHPVGAQVLGDDPEVMSHAAVKFLEIGYDLIDLNFACPAPKVLRRARGGHLMQQPEIIKETLRLTKERVDTPVFMKIRRGFDDSEQAKSDFWTICETAAEGGVDMLAIHGRTVCQRYKGKADWEIIAEAKRRFPEMTIFGSGDIMTAETAVGRLRESGINGIIVARGAIGNPWIFEEIRALYNNQPMPAAPTLQEQGQKILEHFQLICDERTAKRSTAYFRKFCAGYCRRHPQRKKTLLAIMACKQPDEVIETVKCHYEL